MVTDWAAATPKVISPKTLVFQPPLTVTSAGTVVAANAVRPYEVREDSC
jgi:hypothetical protein